MIRSIVGGKKKSEEEIHKAVDNFRIHGEVGKAEEKVNYVDQAVTVIVM
jgi:hypothetical protein